MTAGHPKQLVFPKMSRFLWGRGSRVEGREPATTIHSARTDSAIRHDEGGQITERLIKEHSAPQHHRAYQIARPISATIFGHRKAGAEGQRSRGAVEERSRYQ